MSLFQQGNGNWQCPRCGRLGFPTQAAAENCSCHSGGMMKKCPACSGTGYQYGNSQIMCSRCGGTGKVNAY